MHLFFFSSADTFLRHDSYSYMYIGQSVFENQTQTSKCLNGLVRHNLGQSIFCIVSTIYFFTKN